MPIQVTGKLICQDLSTTAVSWCPGVPLPIRMPNNCYGNAAPVLLYLGQVVHAVGYHLGAICC
jgi:hypothetical protein